MKSYLTYQTPLTVSMAYYALTRQSVVTVVRAIVELKLSLAKGARNGEYGRYTRC